jgi:hypothetical protein
VAEQGFAGVEFRRGHVGPVTLQPALTHGRQDRHGDASWMVMVARLAPGATIDQARAELAVLANSRTRAFLDAKRPSSSNPAPI